MGMPAWATVIISMVLLFRGRTLVNNRPLARSLRQYLLVFVCQMTMTVVCPAFAYLYSTLSSIQQTGAILLLSIIKITAKNWISRTLPDSDDAIPEAVVFNVEIFHTLFVSICMSSPRTVAALVLIDFIQAWLWLKDVHDLLSDLSPISTKLARARKRLHSSDRSLSTQGWQGLVAMCNRTIECEPTEPRRGTRSHWSVIPMSSSIATVVTTKNQVVPTTTTSIVPGTLKPATQATLQGLGHHRGSIVAPFQEKPSTTPISLPSDLVSLNFVERGVLVTHTHREDALHYGVRQNPHSPVRVGFEFLIMRLSDCSHLSVLEGRLMVV